MCINLFFMNIWRYFCISTGMKSSFWFKPLCTESISTCIRIRSLLIMDEIKRNHCEKLFFHFILRAFGWSKGSSFSFFYLHLTKQISDWILVNWWTNEDQIDPPLENFHSSFLPFLWHFLGIIWCPYDIFNIYAYHVYCYVLRTIKVFEYCRINFRQGP